MARLIVGHTTNKTATVWVRGDARYPNAFVTLWGGRSPKEETISLEARHGYTGAVEFGGLKQRASYTVKVRFGRAPNQPPHQRIEFGHCRAQFTTFAPTNAKPQFSFILGSCNLHSLGWVSSPDRAFEELIDIVEKEKPAFTVHCGDQIYYDIPYANKPPAIEEYRAKYVDAWGDSRPTRQFLTTCPQYMVMDDHEITNDFANDMRSPSGAATPRQYRDISMKVYREFVHLRQPNDFGRQALYYTFNYGKAQFFVLDTRTERYTGSGGLESQLIGDDQMLALLHWLDAHKTKPKFIVSSVPFVTEIRHDNDKWCAAPFKAQREHIIRHVHDKNIESIVFLTGDMHNSYHATMEIRSNRRRVMVHELMSSPINQLQKSGYNSYESDKLVNLPGDITYRSIVREKDFYNAHSNAMLVKVDDRTVEYEVFRTKKTKRKEIRGSFTV